MVALCMRNMPLLRKLQLLLIAASVFYFDHLWYGAAAGSVKYSHGPLVSALSTRSHEYGTPTSVGTSPSGVLGVRVDGPKTALGTPVNSAVAAVDALESPTDAGGEVVVPKTFPMNAQEPTCEQLRAMWIFSKRQSRAAEITNEIPTYRDPFAYNVWEPYYSTTRSMGGGVRMLPRYGDRSRSPVFGRVVSREPLIPQRLNIGNRQRSYGLDGSNYGSSSSRVYGAEAKSTSTSQGGAGSTSNNGSRRPSKYRYVGANGSTAIGANGGNANSVNVQGSFQRLKELIWTERAKELTQQRRAEELAARAAALKEIANGQNFESSYKPPTKSESPLMDENRSPDRDTYQHLNDGRMSIATGQSHYIESNYNNKKNSNSNTNSNYDHNKDSNNRRKNSNIGINKHNFRGNIKTGNRNNNNNNRNGGGNKESDAYMETNSGGPTTSSLRSYMTSNRNRNTKNYGTHKYFPLLPPANAGSSATTPKTSNYFDDEQDIDVPRTYPMVPSHFRERNRVIFKEDLPLEKSAETDYYSREIRSQSQNDLPSNEIMLLERVIQNLKRHTSMPAINAEFMDNYLTNKSRIENEAAPATFDNFYSDELDVFALPSDANNADNPADDLVIEDPLATNIQGWNELDVADANAFLNYVNPLIGYRAKETADPVKLYDYGNFY